MVSITGLGLGNIFRVCVRKPGYRKQITAKREIEFGEKYNCPTDSFEPQHKIILKLLNPKHFVTSRNIVKVIKYTEEER